MPGTLYIVATPIGNLEDITLRALRVLREVDLIAAEDTRVTRKLLSRYDIHTPTLAYHQHSRGGRAEQILDQLHQGKNVALVSDAGTPGISDPGHELIAMCIGEGIPVQAVPGPAALIAALVVSGLPTAHFAFDGFPPRKEGERRAFFASLKNDTRTLCFYESPMRLAATLRTMLDEFGDREVAVVREATKLHEEIFRGTLTSAVERFGTSKVRGEVVVVVRGALWASEDTCELTEEALESRISQLLEEGFSERDAVRRCVIEFKIPRRRAYAAALRLKDRYRDDPTHGPY